MVNKKFCAPAKLALPRASCLIASFGVNSLFLLVTFFFGLGGEEGFWYMYNIWDSSWHELYSERDCIFVRRANMFGLIFVVYNLRVILLNF